MLDCAMVGVAKLSGKSDVLHAVIYAPKDYQYVGRGMDKGKRIQENKKAPYRSRHYQSYTSLRHGTSFTIIWCETIAIGQDLCEIVIRLA